jgi:hypothetical protein
MDFAKGSSTSLALCDQKFRTDVPVGAAALASSRNRQQALDQAAIPPNIVGHS